ncbi:MAG: aldo/keto reductase [Hyphomicrobiales bacterium]
MHFLKNTSARMGMGCWAIGGPFWDGDTPLGYSGTNDSDSLAAIEASWDCGIRLFDTSAAYGAGHSETLLGQSLTKKDDAIIVSKFGHSIDSDSRQMTGPQYDADYIRWSIEQSRQRLQRDQIDVMLLHLNDLSVEEAKPVFETLAKIRDEGKIAAYGWSTDFPEKLKQTAEPEGFQAVEYAMNIFFDAPSMNQVTQDENLVGLIRSPLAMGILTDKYSDGTKVATDDIRGTNATWLSYFRDGVISEDFARQLEAIRELISTGGRSPAQGALCWLLATHKHVFPVPGAKNAHQAIENAKAVEFGPLPQNTMLEIEEILKRPPEGAPQER